MSQIYEKISKPQWIQTCFVYKDIIRPRSLTQKSGRYLYKNGTVHLI